MSDLKYLQLRRQTWYIAVTVPPLLRDHIGKKTIIQSLKTRSVDEARNLRWGYLKEIKRYLEDARKGQHTDNGLEKYLARARLLNKDEIRTSAEDEDSRDSMAELVRGEYAAELADEVEQEHGLDAARTIYQAATSDAKTLGDAVDEWMAETTYTGKTKLLYRAALTSFSTWTSPTGIVFVNGVNRKQAGRYISEHLMKTGRSPKTNNRDITAIRRCWDWMRTRGLVDENPWTDQKIPTGSKRGNSDLDGRVPYSDDELARLLAAAPTYGKPHNMDLHDVLAIGALTGARLEEICSLKVSSCTGGIFSITEGKTKSAVRKFPIHSGLVEMVARRSKGKEQSDYLFDDLHSSGPDNRRSEAFGKRLARLARGSAGIDDKRKTFHSLRHRFISNALDAGIDYLVIEAVVGHSSRAMAVGTYNHAQMMKAKRQCVEAVSLPVK